MSQVDIDGDGIGDACDSVDNSPESSGGGFFSLQILLQLFILSLLRTVFRRFLKDHVPG